MTMRRIGLVLTVVLAVAAIPSALDIEPNPATGEIGILPIVIAVLTCAIAATTLALLVPAWSGRRWAALVIAVAQLAGILTALPVFFAPAEVVPPGGVILASVGSLVTVAVVALILSDASPPLLNAIAIIVTVALYAGLTAVGAMVAPAGAQRLVQTVVAVALAVAYAPLLVLLRRTVGRLLYGGRAEPAATAVRIGRRALDGEDALGAALQDTALALRFPRIEVVADRSVLAIGTTDAPTDEASVLIALDSEETLHLRVTLRRGEHALHREDRASLALLASPLALLARQATLLAEVRSARTALAGLHEREQLALHRELHDGLGPLLTGAVMRADAARNLLTTSNAEAAQQLDASRSDLRAAIVEVRRVVYRLWPVELEQRGLRDALIARAARTRVAVRIPEELAPLPPVIELALYRVAMESLTNIDKHAPGAAAELVLERTEDAATLTVTNTTPPGVTFVPGVGLTSLRARAEELGGSAEAGPVPEGWRVHVRIPLDAAPAGQPFSTPLSQEAMSPSASGSSRVPGSL